MCTCIPRQWIYYAFVHGVLNLNISKVQDYLILLRCWRDIIDVSDVHVLPELVNGGAIGTVEHTLIKSPHTGSQTLSPKEDAIDEASDDMWGHRGQEDYDVVADTDFFADRGRTFSTHRSLSCVHILCWCTMFAPKLSVPVTVSPGVCACRCTSLWWGQKGIATDRWMYTTRAVATNPSPHAPHSLQIVVWLTVFSKGILRLTVSRCAVCTVSNVTKPCSRSLSFFGRCLACTRHQLHNVLACAAIVDCGCVPSGTSAAHMLPRLPTAADRSDDHVNPADILTNKSSESGKFRYMDNGFYTRDLVTVRIIWLNVRWRKACRRAVTHLSERLFSEPKSLWFLHRQCGVDGQLFDVHGRCRVERPCVPPLTTLPAKATNAM